MACSKGFIAFIVFGSFFLACVVTIACTGALVAAPSYWAQDFQVTTCETLSSTFLGIRTCSCGGGKYNSCSAGYPCYGILVRLFNNTSFQAKIYYDETLGINQNECSYIPSCNRDLIVNNASVNAFLDVFGEPGAVYSCLYNPEGPSQVIIIRRFKEAEVVASLAVPGVFLGLFGIATGAAAFVWCSNKYQRLNG